ncbi:MAG: hypothetical protein LBC18_02240 [Opitutaceae bacterium]|jgi:hypothetical protein|nr:hypothetical protein [Opitutaceae bacterium]
MPSNFKPRKFYEVLHRHRHPDASDASTRAVAYAAAELAGAISEICRAARAPEFALHHAQIMELALCLAEMAEDISAGGGVWDVVEHHNQELFGTPLPLFARPAADTAGAGSAPRGREMDWRRFAFFLHTVWPFLFEEKTVIAARDLNLKKIAAAAAGFFKKTFLPAAAGSASAAAGGVLVSIKTLLNKTSHDGDFDGADLKKKLIWFGTHSWLLRFGFSDYLLDGKNVDEHRATDLIDDYLCQNCSPWSGLGTTDFIARLVDSLTDSDRADLASWHERHRAFFRYNGRAPAPAAGGAGFESVENLLVRREYLVRARNFLADFGVPGGCILSGSLARWRGAWRWSGAQEQLGKISGAALEEILAKMRVKMPRVVYRYDEKLLAKAREMEALLRDDFVKYYNGNFAVFPDGLAYAASEQRRMRKYTEARMRATGMGLQEFQKKHGRKDPAPNMKLPPGLLNCPGAVAMFYEDGDGAEIITEYGGLLAALRGAGDGGGVVTAEQRAVLLDTMTDAEIGPAFVRRIVAGNGARGIAELFVGKNAGAGATAGGDETGAGADEERMLVEYLLRRFKGERFRQPRYPSISLTDG